MILLLVHQLRLARKPNSSVVRSLDHPLVMPGIASLLFFVSRLVFPHLSWEMACEISRCRPISKYKVQHSIFLKVLGYYTAGFESWL